MGQFGNWSLASEFNLVDNLFGQVNYVAPVISWDLLACLIKELSRSQVVVYYLQLAVVNYFSVKIGGKIKWDGQKKL